MPTTRAASTYNSGRKFSRPMAAASGTVAVMRASHVTDEPGDTGLRGACLSRLSLVAADLQVCRGYVGRPGGLPPQGEGPRQYPRPRDAGQDVRSCSLL